MRSHYRAVKWTYKLRFIHGPTQLQLQRVYIHFRLNWPKKSGRSGGNLHEMGGGRETLSLVRSITGTHKPIQTLRSVFMLTSKSFSMINLKQFNQIYEKKTKKKKTDNIYSLIALGKFQSVALELPNHDWNTHYQV